MNNLPRPYRGRFAPSPTGDLHIGSLVAAVASYLDARSNEGAWLVRIEDIDPPREVPGSAQGMIEELERFGMKSDADVLYQSSRIAEHEKVVEQLIDDDAAYWCGCSRSDMPDSGIYPGTCRRGLPQGRKPRSVRVKVDSTIISFDDQVQGRIEARLDESVGDFVIRRADGLPAYQLAVVVDDAFQNVSHIVRGADLLDSTSRQVFLQQRLGLNTPAYAHVPVVLGEHDEKLSKRLQSDPLTRQNPAGALGAALRHLGHRPPATPGINDLWDWALANWDLARVPRTRESRGNPRAHDARRRL